MSSFCAAEEQPHVSLGCEEARGRERLRRVTWTAAAALFLRGTSILSNFVSIPLTLKYLGPERYGIWVAMSSVIMLLSFADCGLGCGLMNRVAQGIGKNDDTQIRKAVSSTFFVLLLLALGLIGIFTLLFPFIPWQTIFRTRSIADGIATGHAVAVMVALFLLTMPFSTVQRVQMAYQEGFQSLLWQVGGIALGLGGLLLVISRKGGLSALALSSSLGPLISVVLNWCWQFSRTRPWLRPRYAFWNSTHSKDIMTEGGYFLILQIAGTAVFSIDSLLIVQLFGPRSLTDYNLIAKLFQLGPLLASVWFAPLWPAYSESLARGDLAWARKTLLSSLRTSLLGCAAVCLGLSFFIRPLVFLWTRTAVNPPLLLILGFSLYCLCLTGTSAIAAFLNGSGYIRGQAILVTIHALVSVGLKLFLCHRLNIAGIVWGTGLSYILVIIPAYAVIVPRQLAGHNHPAPVAS